MEKVLPDPIIKVPIFPYIPKDLVYDTKFNFFFINFHKLLNISKEKACFFLAL